MPTYDFVLHDWTLASCFAARAIHDEATLDGETVTIGMPSPLNHLGGMHTAGICALVDYPAERIERGLWYEMSMIAARAIGGPSADINYSFRIDQKTAMDSLLEIMDPITGLDLIPDAPCTGVVKDAPNHPTALICGGTEVATRNSILEGGYEGDLLVFADIMNTYGRTSVVHLDESLAGISYGERVIRSFRGVDDDGNRYDNISPGRSVRDFEGDNGIQGTTVRFVMSERSDRRPFGPPQRPDGMPYSPLDFEDVVHEAVSRGMTHVFGTDWHFYRLMDDPSGGMTASRPRPSCAGLRGINQRDQYRWLTEWPTLYGNWERRKWIMRQVAYRLLGTLWTLQIDPRVRPELRASIAALGLPSDVFSTNYLGMPGFPPLIYVRQCRTLIGQVLLTEHDFAIENVPEEIVKFSYFVDKHTVSYEADFDLTCFKEGSRGHSTSYRTTGMPLKALLPHRNQCLNMAFPVNPSVTDVLFQPWRMNISEGTAGEVLGVAMYLAAKLGVALVDLPFATLKPRLVARGLVSA